MGARTCSRSSRHDRIEKAEEAAWNIIQPCAILPGIADAMVVWIRNYAHTDPYPSEDKCKVGKKKRKA